MKFVPSKTAEVTEAEADAFWDPCTDVAFKASVQEILVCPMQFSAGALHTFPSLRRLSTLRAREK